MQKIIITSCGTSLYRSSCWKGFEKLSISSLSPEQLTVEGIYRNQSLCEGIIKTYQSSDQTGKDLADVFELTSWKDLARLKDLPAELASLRSIQEYCVTTDNPINENDTIILIHSDNTEGFFCASVLFNTLCKLKVEKYINACPKLLEIKGLDPENPKEFSDALHNMRETVKEMMKNTKDIDNTEFLFNLTGGYKGVVIVLGALAYGRSADNHVNIFYLHESVSHGGIATISFRDGNQVEGVFDPGTKEHYISGSQNIHPPGAFSS